ncbi:MAG: Asp-tRNA(Asn)/Glu-tRNA(Gln) amidotransferase subunit GatC [Candidatus Saccharimonadaceae bacterium]
MSTISDDDVKHLATLSNIQLAEDEAAGLRQDLTNILDYIEQLGELDTANVEPTYQVTGLQNVWRDDIIDDSGVLREDLLNLAPEQRDSQIKVPKVL